MWPKSFAWNELARKVPRPHPPGGVWLDQFDAPACTTQETVGLDPPILGHREWFASPSDVTLHEDATRLTVGNSGHNMAILNNLVISLCLQHGFDNLAKARRLLDANVNRAVELIFSV